MRAVQNGYIPETDGVLIKYILKISEDQRSFYPESLEKPF